MAKTYNKMNIDMNGDILSSVTAVAQDTLSRYLDCNLYNNGVPLDLTGHMAQLYVTKPDKTLVVAQGEITDAAVGRVQFELTNQILAATGVLELQIVLTSGAGEVLSSEIFHLTVLPSLRDDEAIESTNEFGALVVLFQEIQNSLDLMNAIIESFGEPGEVAEKYGATTFWGLLEKVVGNVDIISALKNNVNSTMGTDYSMPINKMISSLSGTKDFVPLDLLIKALFGSSVTFVTDGTFTVPEGVYKIKVTAAGGGGGGGAMVMSGCGGGGGGACIVGVYDVTPGQVLSITIGIGGEGAPNDVNGYCGCDGSATVVGNLVTAPGGEGGNGDDSNSDPIGAGGAAGGTGGGAGGTAVYNVTATDGEDGAFGKGGKTSGGTIGGGGGSYGDGGEYEDTEENKGGNGIYGGGGSGGIAYGAGRGGDGIVIIEWGANVA